MSKKFEIIKKKNLPDEAHIKGFTFLKEPSQKDKDNNKFDFISKSNSLEIGCFKNNRSSFALTKGYVRVDNTVNDYIEVKSRFFIIPLILIIAILVVLIVFLAGNKDTIVIENDTTGEYEIAESQKEKVEEDENVVKNEDTITFSGFGKYTVTEKNPNIEVKNSAKNIVDFMFTLKDKETGEIIAKTKKVRPGEYLYVNVVNYYKTPGVYKVVIETSTFDIETGQQMNGMTQEMEVTVK